MAPGPALAVKLEARLRTILTVCAIAFGVLAIALGAGYFVSRPVTLKLAVPNYDTASQKVFGGDAGSSPPSASRCGWRSCRRPTLARRSSHSNGAALISPSPAPRRCCAPRCRPP